MALDWEGNSAIVCGLLIENKIAKNCVRPDLFFSPYDDIVQNIQDGKFEIEELIETVGLSPIQASLDAVHSLNGLHKANWVSLLEKSKAYYDAGYKLERLSRKLTRGEEIDWSELNVLSEKAQAGIGGDFVPLADVDDTEVQFVPSGWAIWDKHIGGDPPVGLTTIGGQPGVGKTSLVTKKASKYAIAHPDKNVAIFEVEMMLPEIAARFRTTENLPESVQRRILLNEHPVTPEEVINKAATIPNLGMVFVDFIDLMVRGDNSESAYAHIYRTLALGSKSLNCNVVALAQLTKETGIPRPKYLRYTKLAEALSWMIVMPYNPNTDWNTNEGDADLLPPIKNSAYLIFWKIRGGFRIHREESPGAIRVGFRGDKGWGEKNSQWYSLRKSI